MIYRTFILVIMSLLTTGWTFSQLGALVIATHIGDGQWQPSEIASLYHWFDADDSSTLHIVDGHVAIWSNRVPSRAAVSQSTEVRRPQFQEAGLAERPTLYFDGVHHNLWSHDISLPANAITLFVVFDSRTSGSAATFVVSNEGSSGNKNRLYMHPHGVEFSGSSILVSPDAYTNAPMIMMGSAGPVATNATQRVRVNGGDATQALVDRNAARQGRLNLAGHSPNNTDRTEVYLSEVLMFEEELADSERLKVEGYLAHKWGLSDQLPAEHIYKGNAP